MEKVNYMGLYIGFWSKSGGNGVPCPWSFTFDNLPTLPPRKLREIADEIEARNKPFFDQYYSDNPHLLPKM